MPATCTLKLYEITFFGLKEFVCYKAINLLFLYIIAL